MTLITATCPAVVMSRSPDPCGGKLRVVMPVASGTWCECETCGERCVVPKPPPVPEEVPLSGPPKRQKFRRDTE